jgi:hypothetical protein
MSIQWNEIKSRALLFSQTWADACNEKSQSSHFWIDFMGIFGIPNKRMVSFEHNILIKPPTFTNLVTGISNANN